MIDVLNTGALSRRVPIVSFLMILLLSCPVLLSCQKNEPPPTIKIGLIAYLHGADRELYDYPTLYGSQLAAENLEAAGGIVINGRNHKIDILVEKIEPNPEQAVIAARKLINRDGVVALVGPQYSSDAIPAGAIAEAAHVPMISPSSTHPDTTRNRKYVFRMSFLDDLQGRAMALLAYSDLGARRAAVVFNEAEPYSKEISTVFQQAFTALGGDIAVFSSFLPGDSDFTELLKFVKKSQVDVLYLPVYQRNLEKLASLARQMGITAQLLGSDTWDQDKNRKMRDFNDSYMSNSWNKDLPNQVTGVFVSQYLERFAERPNSDSALTYDAFQLIFKVISEQQNFSPESIQQGLYQLGSFSGVAGEIDFVSSGDPVKSVVIMHIADGESRFFRLVLPQDIQNIH